jgi:hypothetical protein
MCHFISFLIDKQTPIDVLNQVGLDYAIIFEKCNNDFVKSQLHANEEYLIKKTKSCDCGTQLGLITRLVIPETRIEKKELDKLVKRGWSLGKIERWKTERHKTLEKDKINYSRIISLNHVEIANWVEYLNTIFTRTKISYVGLFLHWYKGGLQSERIKIERRIKVRIADLTPDTLLKMNEDVIYEIWN